MQATGGGTDSDASRASRATDVELNQMQDSVAVDHFQVQEMRRQQQRPQVFRIDTSEDEPQAQ